MKHTAVLAAAGAAVAVGAVQEYVSRRYYARTPGPRRFFYTHERSAWTAPWHEAAAPAEWLALRLSPVHRGRGVPRGDGAPVLLVPGFLTVGWYLGPLRRWLARMGYDARVADIGLNADCLDVMTNRVLDVVEATRRETGRRVHLVGHSLGGVLARAAAAREPQAIASVATLAAPFRGLRLNPGLRGISAAVRAITHARRGAGVRPACLTFACDCESVTALGAPLPADIPQMAIVARHDGVTDYRYCQDAATTRVVTVMASHVGLALNAKTYEAIAAHLAEASRSEQGRPGRAAGTAVLGATGD